MEKEQLSRGLIKKNKRRLIVLSCFCNDGAVAVPSPLTKQKKYTYKYWQVTPPSKSSSFVLQSPPPSKKAAAAGSGRRQPNPTQHTPPSPSTKEDTPRRTNGPLPPQIRHPLPHTDVVQIIQPARLHLGQVLGGIVIEAHLARAAELHFVGLVVALRLDGAAGVDALLQAGLALLPAVLGVAELQGAGFPEGEGGVRVGVAVEGRVEVVCLVCV